MRISKDTPKRSKTESTPRRHLRVVPSRTSKSDSSPTSAPTRGRERFSPSAQRAEEARGGSGTDDARADAVIRGLQDSEGFFDDVRDVAGDAVGGVRDVAGGVRDVAGGVRDTVGDVVGGTRDTIGDVVGGVQDVVGGVRDTADDVRDAAGGLVDRIFGNSGRDDGRLAEEREEDATVAVIDYFAEGDEDPEHGDIVESIIKDNSGLSDEDIQRYRAGGGPGLDSLVDADPDEFGEVLDGYIEGRVTGLLDTSSGAIADILSDEDSSIRTINQSLGVPESRIAGDIARRFGEDPEFRDRFLEYAGLESDADEREVLQALVDEVSDSRRSNETIQESKDRYDELVAEAHDRGITTIDSSGNYGRFARQLEELGVETDDQFHTDVLNNEHVLSVGATDTNGTAGIKDDEESTFSSPNAGADIAAQGTDVTTVIDGEEVGGNGTSFSAPQVSAAAAVLAEQYPELSASEIQSILIDTAINPNLDEETVGAGILQQQAALDRAEQLAA